MALDGVVLTAVTDELKKQLLNSRIVKIYQPRRWEIILHCRQPGSHYQLLLSADPQNARIHLSEDTPDNPLQPPSFCMLLRKHLTGGRIVSIEQPRMERILQIVVENIDAEGQIVRRTIIAEVMGKHSNITLVDTASGVILDAISRVTSDINRYRELVPGATYIFPPAQDKISPLEVKPDTLMHRLAPARPDSPLYRLLVDNFLGIGPTTAKEIVFRAGYTPQEKRGALEQQELHKLYASLRWLAAIIRAGEFTPCVVLGENGKPEVASAIRLEHCHQTLCTFSSMSQALEAYYQQKLTAQHARELAQKLHRIVNNNLQRVNKKLEAQQKALQRAEKADTYRIYGELLTAHLYQVKPGATEITVPNYYASDQARITIPLDNRLSPADNAQAYFRRYNKAKKTRVKAAQQAQYSRQEKEYLEQVQTALELATTLPELEDIYQELQSEGYIATDRNKKKRQVKKTAAPSDPWKFRSSDGLEILVGKNNHQNDRITLSTARPDDIWLHVKDIPGSHVIVRRQNGDIPETTLQEAALLAAYYSKAREGSNVPVDYTYRKYVRKPKGARPGMVIYDHQTTLYATPRAEFMQSILSRRIQ